jgi:hypothetical protein
MKILYSILIALLLTGCYEERATTHITEADSIPKTIIPADGYFCSVRVMMVTNSGHRFLLVHSSYKDAVSVCEVTDASAIESK